MKENHIAYKIVQESADLVCSHSEFQEDKMLDLLKDIKKSQAKGIYWVFKKLDNQPQEQLCIIDCAAGRIYYHYSGEVIGLDDLIKKLES